MLFDTDVLIWYLRGHAQAAKVIAQADDPTISIVTYMELVQGARNRQEIRTIAEFLRMENIRQLELSSNIGTRAIVYLEQYALSHSL